MRKKNVNSPPIYKRRSENELQRLYSEAEEIKNKAWPHHMFGESFEEKVAALRTIVRCNYLKAFCGCMIHSKVGLSYKEEKIDFLFKNRDRFEKEEINGI